MKTNKAADNIKQGAKPNTKLIKEHSAKSAIYGYSGKPLYQKLGLKPGMICVPLYAPEHYYELVSGAGAVKFQKTAKAADMVHLFCRRKNVLTTKIGAVLNSVTEGGMVWISWPKKSSPLYKDLTEDDLRTALLPLGWVDVKVCAIDADWSGLKFLKRRSK